MAQLRIGLTGGIASGKSTVARRFRELGVPLIDADEVARTVVAPGQPALAEVVRRFGAGVMSSQGDLDRRALRNLIFTDAEARSDLETILHPRIGAEMRRLAAAARGPYVVLAIPLLIEGGARDGLDRILVIDADEGRQLARLMARDGCSPPQARAILAAQAGRAARAAKADDILANDGSVEELRARVDRLHQRYLALAAAPVGATPADPP